MRYSNLVIINLVVLLSILSLRSHAQTDISRVSKINIIFYKGKKPLNYLTSNKIIIDACKDLIKKSKNNTAVNCDTTGAILYLDKKNTTLLKVYFSTRATHSKYLSPAVKFNNITSLITYQIGMDVDEIFYRLNK